MVESWGASPQTFVPELPMLLVPVLRKPMYIVNEPDAGTVSEPRFTHTADEVAVFEHNDSHQPLSIVPELSKNSTFCTPELRYALKLPQFTVSICWKPVGVADPWALVSVRGT